MSNRGQRASREAILSHLDNLLGLEAVQIAIKSAALSRAGKSNAALEYIYTYDASLGGIGIYKINDKRPLGVYRPLSYVAMPLRQSGAENYSRFIIQSACGYLEELLKYVVRSWPHEIIKSEGLPLGALVKRAYKHMPSDLADELVWLSSEVYNFAKHEYNLANEFDEQEPEHYFQLDEAIAVYLIVRKLGLQLEQLIGKTPEQLQVEY
jgi:hypothetical protein